MLDRMPYIGNEATCAPRAIEGTERDLKEDLKTAVELVFDLNNKLNKLHPQVSYIVKGWLKGDSR